MEKRERRNATLMCCVYFSCLLFGTIKKISSLSKYHFAHHQHGYLYPMIMVNINFVLLPEIAEKAKEKRQTKKTGGFFFVFKIVILFLFFFVFLQKNLSFFSIESRCEWKKDARHNK